MSSSTHSNGETRIRSANDAEFQKNNRPIFSTSCCTILLLAVITVLMQLLLIMNTTSPSSNNNNLSMMMMSSGAMDDHQQPVLGETQQDDYSTQHNKMDSHVQQRYFEKVTTIKDRERLVSLGQLLLRQGDAIGAFSSCTSVFTTEIVEGGESRPSTDLKDLMDAFVCAGEASIKLYKDALELLHDEPQSSLTPSSTTTSRIEQAKSYFEIAMDLDPMNPRVRTGLGLSLFFIATAPNTDDKYNKSHKSLLLFEAIQHFTTAASYYHKGNREETNDDTIAMQRSCWYNAAFCYIHLQHYSEAIPLLQRAINTHPTDSAEYNTGTNEILSVITEIEKLRYALEAQRLKLEQLLQHATVVLSPKGFNTIQTEIDVDTTALRTPKVMLPSIPDNDMPPSAVADGVAIASTDSSEREPIHSLSQGVADAVQLVSDNVTAESKSTHKIALPSSSDDETIESVTSDYISLESTVKTKASLSSDSDLSTNVVADSDIDASCNDSLMQPVLSSSDDDLGTRDTLNATNNSFLQSMDESGPLLLNPEGISVEDVAIQAVLVDASAANLSSSNVTIFSSSDGDESAPVESILGDDTNLMNDTKVEALPPSDHAVAINTVIDGDTASSSTDAKVDIVSSLVDDRNKHDLTDDNSSLRQLIFPFENDSFVANTSFSKVTLLSPSDEYVRNEPVIGENTAPVSTAEIDSLLPSGNNVAVNAVTDADTAANVFGTMMETLALSDEYIIYKQEQVNENSGLPPLSESLDDSAAQVTSQRDDVKEEETLMPLLYNNDDDAAKVETNATVGDGKDPTLGASTEYELLLQPSFSSPNMTGNTSLNLDVDIPPFSVDDDSASSNVLGDSEDVMSSAKLYDSKDEYKLDLEGKIELPLLYNATPRLNEEVNLSALEESYMKIADSLLAKSNLLRASKQLQKVIKSSPNYLPARLGYANSLEGLDGGKNKNVKEIVLAYVEAAKVALKQDPRTDYLSSTVGDGGLAEAFLNHALGYAKSAPKKDRLEIYNALISAAHTSSLAAELYYHLGAELLSTLKDAKNNPSPMNTNYRAAVRAFLTANQLAYLTSGNEGKGHGKSLVELAKIGLHTSNDKAQLLLKRALACSLDEATRAEVLLLLQQTETTTEGTVKESIPEANKLSELPDVSSDRAHDKDTITKLKSNLKAPGLGTMRYDSRGFRRLEKLEAKP